MNQSNKKPSESSVSIKFDLAVEKTLYNNENKYTAVSVLQCNNVIKNWTDLQSYGQDSSKPPDDEYSIDEILVRAITNRKCFIFASF